MTKNMTTTMTNTFTIEQGLQVQRRHLYDWKTVLKDNVYEKLVEWATSTNGEAKTGYDIRRGSSLSGWVQNYSIDKINQTKTTF
jgi:hypothetical protein